MSTIFKTLSLSTVIQQVPLNAINWLSIICKTFYAFPNPPPCPSLHPSYRLCFPSRYQKWEEKRANCFQSNSIFFLFFFFSSGKLLSIFFRMVGTLITRKKLQRENLWMSKRIFNFFFIRQKPEILSNSASFPWWLQNCHKLLFMKDLILGLEAIFISGQN